MDRFVPRALKGTDTPRCGLPRIIALKGPIPSISQYESQVPITPRKASGARRFPGPGPGR